MLSEIMASIMPPMLPRMALLIALKMTAYLENEAANKEGKH